MLRHIYLGVIFKNNLEIKTLWSLVFINHLRPKIGLILGEQIVSKIFPLNPNCIHNTHKDVILILAGIIISTHFDPLIP